MGFLMQAPLQKSLEAKGIPSSSFAFPQVPPPAGPDGTPGKTQSNKPLTDNTPRLGAPGTRAKSEGALPESIEPTSRSLLGG